MSKKQRFITCLVLLFCLGLCLGGLSVAPAAAAPPLEPFTFMQYKLFRVPDGYTAGVWAFVDAEVELPVTVQVAIPAGVDVFWFGEVPAEGVSPDSEGFPEPYQMQTEGNFDIYTAVLETSRQVQIEFYLSTLPVRSVGNGNHAIVLEYTPLTDLEILRLAAFIPAGSSVVTPGAEFVVAGPTGDLAYGFALADTQGGETYSLEIEYVPPQTTARENADTITGGILVVVVAVVVVAIAAVGLLLFMKSRRTPGRDDDQDYYDDEQAAFE
ncbi:MAG: hypothetical protein FWF11_00350 [Coriobacteriia bacterium]|nr:hypothetical protein [Coriobacteriia bacterium]